MLSNNSESVFEVYYLGMVQNVNQGMSLSQKADVLLIDKVEEAQVSCQMIYPEGATDYHSRPCILCRWSSRVEQFVVIDAECTFVACI